MDCIASVLLWRSHRKDDPHERFEEVGEWGEGRRLRRVHIRRVYIERAQPEESAEERVER